MPTYKLYFLIVIASPEIRKGVTTDIKKQTNKGRKTSYVWTGNNDVNDLIMKSVFRSYVSKLRKHNNNLKKLLHIQFLLNI